MLIGSITNQGSLQGEMNNANGYLTGVITSAGQLGGQVVGLRGLKGDKGETGDKGDTGDDGYSPSASVSKSGNKATITITDKEGTTTADVYDGSSVPSGGTTGQVLTKDSDMDYDASWEDPSGGTITDVTVDGTSIVDDGVAELETATQLRDGLMTALDKQKLDGIASGAEVNVNADWDAVSGDAQILNKPTIPSKTSDLNNDSGFITTETDPTVPSWAKQSSKPTYTASEVGALPDTTPIPSKTSDLTNDSGFITGVTSTSTPTASTIAEFDSSSHINSTDMTSSEVEDFVDELDVGGGGVLNMFYPVGSYYETSDSTFDPNVRWGGTWVLEAEGQVHISAGTNYTVNGALTNASDGGEATHLLTVDEMPSHNHNFSRWGDGTHYYPSSGTVLKWYSSAYNTQTVNVSNKGGGLAHNNMQPYIIVNRWHRTA